MSLEDKNACADMILTAAIEDMADEQNISVSEAREKLLNSRACELLYNFETDLWKEGPDYFRDFYRKLEMAT